MVCKHSLEELLLDFQVDQVNELLDGVSSLLVAANLDEVFGNSL